MKMSIFSQKGFVAVLLGCCAAILLNGCVSEGQRMVYEGASPAYGEGFDAGCASGKKAGGDMFSQFHKNVQLYQRNPDYRQGWNDGYEECKSEWLSMNRQQRLTIEQQRAADEHSLIQSIERTNEQQYVPQYVPKLNAREIEELNRLGH